MSPGVLSSGDKSPSSSSATTFEPSKLEEGHTSHAVLVVNAQEGHTQEEEEQQDKEREDKFITYRVPHIAIGDMWRV